jgi:hypothetical protein
METRTNFAVALAALDPWTPIDGGDAQACYFCGARRRRRDHFAECLWSQAVDEVRNHGQPVRSPADLSPKYWYRAT